jgi:hypothetical protein
MDLICYLHPGWAPHIRPAEATRDWMDQTSEHFAYRCLPLNIANAHGWEVLSPCDVTAIWRGGTDVKDVVIRTPPGTSANDAPVSIFGQGVLTFHIYGIFRTPPGWNLWVGGSPNAAKEGVTPLTGIIESDWSPYSFTMNWRFLRRNHPVTFKKGEPICFLFPVQRAALEQFRPRFAPMTDELMDQFKAWSASRDAFRLEMERNPPAAPADKWQKRYYRGIDMNDRQGVADHRAKLRLLPFAPMAAAVPPPDPELHLRGDAATLGRVLRVIAQGLADGVAPDTLAAGLQELGLQAGDARAVMAASLQS